MEMGTLGQMSTLGPMSFGASGLWGQMGPWENEHQEKLVPEQTGICGK